MLVKQLEKIKLIKANRFYPSSKICSSCGSIKKDLKLSDRIYKCKCGLSLDRDLNGYKKLIEGAKKNV